MRNLPLTVTPSNWQDRIDISVGLEESLLELFLSRRPYSLATYIEEATFGFIDVRYGSWGALGAVVLRRNTLPVAHQLHMAPDGSWQSAATRTQVASAAASWLASHHPVPPFDYFGGFELEERPPAFPWVIFMLSAPSPAGGTTDGTLGSCVLDWNGTFDYMAHEVCHSLGWQHSWSAAKEYGDPYCIMSARDYDGFNPTHTRQRPADSAISADRDVFWNGGFGPMPAAATLFKEIPEFAASPMVKRVRMDERVTLHALSEAQPGQPVLAVIEIDSLYWMAELRVGTGWDAGLTTAGGPGAAVILHRMPRNRNATDADYRVRYHGRIDVTDPNQTSFQPGAVTPVKMLLHYYNQHTATADVSFSEGPPPSHVILGEYEAPFIHVPDPECTPGGLTPLTLQQGYKDAITPGGYRARFHATIIDPAGNTRTGYGQAPTPDESTGGLLMPVVECKDGQTHGHWQLAIAELAVGGQVSYLFRINGAAAEEITGALNQNSGWTHELHDGTVIAITAWRAPVIH